MVVFSRIVDVEMFSEVVLSVVREEEKRELQHRLGLLNVLNPVRVRSYVFLFPPRRCSRGHKRKRGGGFDYYYYPFYYYHYYYYSYYYYYYCYYYCYYYYYYYYYDYYYYYYHYYYYYYSYYEYYYDCCTYPCRIDSN